MMSPPAGRLSQKSRGHAQISGQGRDRSPKCPKSRIPLPSKKMKPTLVIGLKAELQHRVVTQELLSSVYPGGPPVLATPFLLGLMEQAAARAIQPHLDPGEASVGYGFEFHHLAPTPVGATVVATAEVA